jgi:dihydroorotate dehydrogenase (NAD+) catalytic subunit
MGLPNPGVEEEVSLLEEAARRLAPLGVPLIASISADTAEGFGNAAAIVAQAGPALIEVNISCPNVQSDHGEMFAASAEAAAEVTRRVKSATSIPCIVKLSPNVPDIAAISGPALKPIALRCVHDIAGAVDIPIIGMGGVLTGVDAVEMISAGAACVGVGSAIFYRGQDAFALIRGELERWLEDRGLTLDDIRGRTRRVRQNAVESNPPPVPGWEERHGR